MAKINLNKNFVNLGGDPVLDQDGKPVKMNTFIANKIVGKVNDNPMVALELARILHKAAGEIEVTAEELAIIEAAAKDKNNTTLVSGQILKEIHGEKK
jgi:hypothetical protein